MRLRWLASLVLAAFPLCAGASEEQLLERDAPQSATSVPPPHTVLQRTVDPPLLHPTFSLKLRSYGLGSDSDIAPDQQTWATGGRIGITFPEWHSWLSMGGAGYASFPVGGIDTPNRSRLVAPDGSRLLVAGETYVNARHGNFNLRLFRQLLDAPYLNAQDNRMIPNVFEGYTLLYRTEKLYGGVGYLSKMKTRDSENYVSMAEVAGASDSQSGVIAGGVRWHPSQRSSGSAFVLYNSDIFSIAYVAGEFDVPLGQHTDLRVSGQFTSQNSVGEERIGAFDGHTVGVKAALGYRGAVFTLGATRTGAGEDIRSPFGQRPSYLSMMLFDFDRADEDAWLAGVSYRLDVLGLPSWSFVVNHVEGEGARDPASHALSKRHETDITIDFRPLQGELDGLWLRLRYADGKDGARGLAQWRLTLNYEIQSGH